MTSRRSYFWLRVRPVPEGITARILLEHFDGLFGVYNTFQHRRRVEYDEPSRRWILDNKSTWDKKGPKFNVIAASVSSPSNASAASAPAAASAPHVPVQGVLLVDAAADETWFRGSAWLTAMSRRTKSRPMTHQWECAVDGAHPEVNLIVEVYKYSDRNFQPPRDSVWASRDTSTPMPLPLPAVSLSFRTVQEGRSLPANPKGGDLLSQRNTRWLWPNSHATQRPSDAAAAARHLANLPGCPQPLRVALLAAADLHLVDSVVDLTTNLVKATGAFSLVSTDMPRLTSSGGQAVVELQRVYEEVSRYVNVLLESVESPAAAASEEDASESGSSARGENESEGEHDPVQELTGLPEKLDMSAILECSGKLVGALRKVGDEASERERKAQQRRFSRAKAVHQSLASRCEDMTKRVKDAHNKLTTTMQCMSSSAEQIKSDAAQAFRESWNAVQSALATMLQAFDDCHKFVQEQEARVGAAVSNVFATEALLSRARSSSSPDLQDSLDVSQHGPWLYHTQHVEKDLRMLRDTAFSKKGDRLLNGHPELNLDLTVIMNYDTVAKWKSAVLHKPSKFSSPAGLLMFEAHLVEVSSTYKRWWNQLSDLDTSPAQTAFDGGKFIYVGPNSAPIKIIDIVAAVFDALRGETRASEITSSVLARVGLGITTGTTSQSLRTAQSLVTMAFQLVNEPNIAFSYYYLLDGQGNRTGDARLFIKRSVHGLIDVELQTPGSELLGSKVSSVRGGALFEGRDRIITPSIAAFSSFMTRNLARENNDLRHRARRLAGNAPNYFAYVYTLKELFNALKHGTSKERSSRVKNKTHESLQNLYMRLLWLIMRSVIARDRDPGAWRSVHDKLVQQVRDEEPDPARRFGAFDKLAVLHHFVQRTEYIAGPSSPGGFIAPSHVPQLPDTLDFSSVGHPATDFVLLPSFNVARYTGSSEKLDSTTILSRVHEWPPHDDLLDCLHRWATDWFLSPFPYC